MSDSLIDSVENKPKLVPELRFPEFEKDGEWVEQSLISIADKNVKWSFTGGPFGSNLKASDYMSNGIRILQLQNIGDGEFLDEYKIYTSLEKADELLSCNIYTGDIILSKMGDPVGRACIIPDHLERCVMASDGIRFVVNEIKNSKYFIYSLLNSQQIREAIEKKSTGSTRKRIGLNELKEVLLPLPRNLPEQAKIASCLSSLDELITANREKLEALNAHKKGLMQNLFPQEGQTAPNYRFPEFEDDGEWVVKKLSKSIQLISGLHLSPNEYGSSGEVPYFTGPSEFTNNEPDIKKWTANSSNTAKENDTLITVKGSGVGELWHLSISCVAMGRQLMAVRASGSCSGFLYFFLETKRSRFEDLASGNLIPGLSRKDILDIDIPMPTITEQKKISSCLSEVDKIINAQTEKIELLNLHKKALMQGLFPNNLD